MITFFTTFKNFTLTERNAVSSWLALDTNSEVIIFTETRPEGDWLKSDRVVINQDIIKEGNGPPVLNSIFEEASRISKYEMLCYCNS
ncbi:MAG: hypothetical protein C0490_11430, partial [Marivirga sp.]|nr:hypothetical protein [Marivirga sp.]